MHLFHKWEVVKDTDKYLYLQCKICGARKLKEEYTEGHQPIDWKWLHFYKTSNCPICKFPLPLKPMVSYEKLLSNIFREKDYIKHYVCSCGTHVTY